jgi:hypothetical protein
MRNLRRGFNRIFVILWVGWGLYCAVVYPLRERLKAFDHYQGDLTWCYQENPPADADDCIKLAKEEWQTTVDQWSVKNFYLGAWWLLALAIVAPPLIAYGLAYSAVGVFVWVRHGFRPAR